MFLRSIAKLAPLLRLAPLIGLAALLSACPGGAAAWAAPAGESGWAPYVAAAPFEAVNDAFRARFPGGLSDAALLVTACAG